MAIEGIPTMYAGTRFRSRLEARWACFFDLLGWRWEYEPFDLDGYIPDFLILGKLELQVEVKPLGRVSELVALAERTPCSSGREILAVGVTPTPEDDIDDNLAGWYLGGLTQWDEDLGGNLGSARAEWHHCTAAGCGLLVCHHEIQSFAGRPCGHGDGDRYIGRVDPMRIEMLWSEARNRTQWKPAP